MTPGGKRSIAEHRAAASFVTDTIENAERAWPSVVEQLKSSFQLDIADLASDNWAMFEFGLAVLAIESQAIANLMPSEQATRILSWVVRYLDGPELEGAGKESFKAYGEAWTKAVEEADIPFTAVASVLCDRLEFDATVDAGTIVFKNPLVLTALGGAIVTTGGGWWKRLTKEYKVIE